MFHLKRLFKVSAGQENLCLCIGDLEQHDRTQTSGGSFSVLQFGKKPDHAPGLKSFYKHQIGCYTRTATSHDGTLTKSKVLGRLERMLARAHGQIVIVHYRGEADRGDGTWLLPHHTGSISFDELRTLWTQHRKHSQRMLIVADCPGSLHWVGRLASLPKSEALELNMCVQAAQAELAQAVSAGTFSDAFVAYHVALMHPPTGQPAQPPPGSYFCTWGAANLRDFGVQLHFCSSSAPGGGGVHGSGLVSAGISAPSELLFASERGGEESEPGSNADGPLPALPKQRGGVPAERARGLVALSTPEVEVGSGMSQAQVGVPPHAGHVGKERHVVALMMGGQQGAGGSSGVTDGPGLSFGSQPSVEDTGGTLGLVTAPTVSAGLSTGEVEDGMLTSGHQQACVSGGGSCDLRRTMSAVSDSAQEEWAANNRRNELAHNERMQRAHLGNKAAGVASLNNDELGRRLGQEAGWRVRVGRRGAMGGEEDDICDDAVDEQGIPSRDSSAYRLPLTANKGTDGGPGGSPTSVTGHLGTPNPSIMATPSPSTAPSRARTYSVGGVTPIVVSPHGIAASSGSMTGLSPVGSAAPSRLARMTSAANTHLKTADEAPCPWPTMAQQQWDLSSELLGLAPDASTILEQSTMLASSPAQRRRPSAPGGIMHIINDSNAGSETPDGGSSERTSATVPPTATHTLMRGFTVGREPGRPGLAPMAAVALMQALQSLPGAQPSDNLLKHLLEASDSTLDRLSNTSGAVDERRRGRRAAIEGDEPGSFLFNDDEEKWRMLQALVADQPELGAEVESLRTMETMSRMGTMVRPTAAQHAGLDALVSAVLATASRAGGTTSHADGGTASGPNGSLPASCGPNGSAGSAAASTEGAMPPSGIGQTATGGRGHTAAVAQAARGISSFTLPLSTDSLLGMAQVGAGRGQVINVGLSTFNMPSELVRVGEGTQLLNSLMSLQLASHSQSSTPVREHGDPVPGGFITTPASDLLSATLNMVAMEGRNRAVLAGTSTRPQSGGIMISTDEDGRGLLGTVNELLELHPVQAPHTTAS